jgi:hypothetical protein
MSQLGVGPVAALEGSLLDAVDRLVGCLVGVDVPDALAALLEYKIPFEGDAPGFASVS